MSDSDFVVIVTNGTRRVIQRDEPVFLIRGQDIVGGDAVRAWADLAEARGADPVIVQTAREHASKMDGWLKKKTPDLPPNAGTAIDGEEPVGCCESCEKPLFEGDLAHSDFDGGYLCADCAPSYDDLLRCQMPFADEEGDEMTQEARTAIAENHVAAGGSLDDKMVSPI